MRLHRISLVSVEVALVLGMAAPFGRSAIAAPAVCSLITRAEAAAALGAPVPAGTEKNFDFAGSGGQMIKARACLYGSEVLVARYDLGSNAANLFAGYRKSLLSNSDYLNVTGVGDEAFRAKGQLALRKGQTGFIVDVGQARGGGAKELAKEKSVALLVLSRS